MPEAARARRIERQIVDLSPRTEAQRWFKSQALALMNEFC
jgi:hypothetical protein